MLVYLDRAHPQKPQKLDAGTLSIGLTAEELSILRNLLETEISNLGAEIHHTRTLAYRESLKTLRETFKKLDRELVRAGSQPSAQGSPSV